MKRIAINGFGRIGKLCLKLLEKEENIAVVAINTGSKAKHLPHLLRYDSTYGIDRKNIDQVAEGDRDYLIYGKEKSLLLADRDPKNLPWRALDIDVVFECTGKLTDEASLHAHISAGARRVLVSAPAKGNIKTIVMGVNDCELSSEDKIISNASCTTNCLAPIAKVIHENFHIKSGFLTTVHSYTSDQNLLDASHKDPRRARSAARSIVPTTTGATKSIGKVIPELEGKLEGISLRVPVDCGSMIDLVLSIEENTTVSQINDLVKQQADSSLKGILQYNDAPIVSVDIIGNTASSIFDATLTNVVGKTIKVISWYDNELAYAQRMCDVVKKWLEN